MMPEHFQRRGPNERASTNAFTPRGVAWIMALSCAVGICVGVLIGWATA